MFVGYTKDHEGDFYNMLHLLSRNIYQINNVTWLKRMYYQKEFDENNEDLLPFPKEDDNNNDEQYDDDKLGITDTGGNESASEENIMSEDEDADHAVIDRESVNWIKTTRSGRVMKPPSRLKVYESGGASLYSYKQAVTLTPSEEKFYLQIKELNELQLFSNNGIPCVEELDDA